MTIRSLEKISINLQKEVWIMDKETQEGMRNLDVTAEVGDIVKAASAPKAEFSEEELQTEINESES
jgi:hypothetical protein